MGRNSYTVKILHCVLILNRIAKKNQLSEIQIVINGLKTGFAFVTSWELLFSAIVGRAFHVLTITIRY